MHYGEIKKTDIANGTGVRVSLFVSGCTHHCEGCFNPETWSFSYGKPFTRETEEELLTALAPSHIEGLTLLGGEPMEPENQKALLPFLERVKERFPQKTIWCYTGYTLESDLLGSCADAAGRIGRARCRATDAVLSLLDVLVDGEFVSAKKDIRLKFRGSANQRILDMKASLQKGEAVLHMIEKRYRFYGWESASITPVTDEYPSIRSPRDLYDALSELWCEGTCAPRMRKDWSSANRTLGQCSVTAFLAQDIFGGRVFGIPREGGSFHCYNVVGDCCFDLTSEQFLEEAESLVYENNPEQFREVHFAKEEKKQRYLMLKQALGEWEARRRGV